MLFISVYSMEMNSIIHEREGSNLSVGIVIQSMDWINNWIDLLG